MYLLVKLLKGYSQPLFYKTTENNVKNVLGKIVKVPLKKQFLPALVIRTYDYLPKKINFKIKEILNVEKFPEDRLYNSFVEKISKFYFVENLHFYQRIRHFLLKQNNDKNNLIENNLNTKNAKQIDINLTDQQKQIYDYLKVFVKDQKYTPTILHGVTGSGKTEVYKKLIIEAIENDKTVVLLLPEVSLSLQFQHLLKNQLPTNINIIGFHSASKLSEKKMLWQNLIEKKPMLIIGVHLPVLLPIPNLGLIIVDEEHETGFQEKKHPKINSKELAIWKAQHYNIPILLGSATPSLNSLFNVKKNGWKFFQLNKRFSGNFPKIKTVLLNKKTLKRRNSFWISNELEEEIKNTLNKNEQVIIYLNRRGHSFFVQCKKCGFIFQCPNCSVSLTPHIKDKNLSILRCHYCDYQKNLPLLCPDCKTENKNFLTKGIGTQQVVSILQRIFKQAKIERADLDSTSKKKSWQKTVEKFEKGEIDILVGTQTITKGYNFPKVTLVGVLWADLNLNFPIFNASETTLQQLIQVAGRAGRQRIESKVIVQTMQEHTILNYLNEQKYLNFCKKELEFRKETSYPPYSRLIQIELKNINSEKLETDSYNFYEQLHKINISKKLNLKILGPSKPVVFKIQRTESRQIFIKSKTFKEVHELIKDINLNNYNSKIYVIPTQ